MGKPGHGDAAELGVVCEQHRAAGIAQHGAADHRFVVAIFEQVPGRIDAAVSDIPGMQYAFLKMKDLEVKVRIKTGEQYGLMMTKDHPLLHRANDAITAMKKDGTLAAIHKKWFGTEPPAGSATVTELPIPTP